MAAASLEIQTADWLLSTAKTELLRFTTAGSVDDGKSTLIGWLLVEGHGVHEDTLESLRKAYGQFGYINFTSIPKSNANAFGAPVILKRQPRPCR